VEVRLPYRQLAPAREQTAANHRSSAVFERVQA
jgi:hypothetical protein